MREWTPLFYLSNQVRRRHRIARSEAADLKDEKEGNKGKEDLFNIYNEHCKTCAELKKIEMHLQI